MTAPIQARSTPGAPVAIASGQEKANIASPGTLQDLDGSVQRVGNQVRCIRGNQPRRLAHGKSHELIRSVA
jgi:hypothetical protein